MQKKTVFFAGIVLCLLILATVFYWYQKPRSSIINLQPAYTVSAKDLYAAFEQDEKKANEKFVGKVILVKGIADNVQETDSTVSLLLAGGEMGGINCSIAKSKHTNYTMPVKGSVVEVKGRCAGFLMDVNLTDAVIIH